MGYGLWVVVCDSWVVGGRGGNACIRKKMPTQNGFIGSKLCVWNDT